MSEVRKTILFVLPSLAGGGAERVVTTLLRHLDRRKFALRLVLIDGRTDTLRDQVPGDVPVDDLGSPKLRMALGKLLKLIQKQRPDIVFSTLDHLNVALGFMRPWFPKSTRLIVRATDLMNLEHRVLSPLMRLSFPLADGVVYQSDAMQTAFEARLNLKARKGQLIPNPLDRVRIAALAAQGGQAARASFEGPGKHLICVGRLSPAKGFDLLLKALSLATAKDFTLSILGEGDDETTLRQQVADLGLNDRVRFLGFQKNPYGFMAAADGLILPSRYEGFPNVVLEALSCGTPVLATPVPGVAALLSPIDGCVVADSFTPEAIAAALDRFVAALPIRVAPEAVDRFDAPAVTQQYEALFDRVAPG